MSEPIAVPVPAFALQRAYIKGISLEMPKGSATFQQNIQAQTNLDLALAVTRLDENTYESAIRCTITMTDETDKSTVLLLEAEQCGIFEVRNIPEDDLPTLLEIGCPSVITPYLRAAITDILARATLPLFYLPEINWAAVRQQRAAAEQPAAEQLAGKAPALSVVR
jgi:preprotein translocase subunit SecB